MPNVDSLTPYRYPSPPLLVQRVPTDAAVARGVVTLETFILVILSLSGEAQVLPTIIKSIPVDVIYPKTPKKEVV